ncbi:ATP-binding protein [Enterococcus rivorum]|uniref:YhaN AAA domain-containing protein n=1 Tax=Enterococcus rivorum TaxID=762845 RepID=A0A1E5KZG9_9ENTE|nr:AAA family ATPase [Enterococcus rivorum]MBP2099392.1 uncharacterized protein YhaN [Enterococcus rivorum]OEH83256.1 hypothetical protein BCR26_10660 [Enterococcus rivorum]
MKLKAIEMVGFGKWQQHKIEFSAGNQLFYGENEAGKSTIYQFIQVMLFGFPTKGKNKKDYMPKKGGLYGGYLWLEHPIYGEVKIERFKDQRKGQAKVYCNQQIGDEKLLEKIVHPLTKELAQSVYTFQQEQLNELNKLGEEELQKSLLSLGVSGSHQLLTSREEYFKKAQMLYKGKGSQPPLNQKLIAFQELQKKIDTKEKQEQSFQEVITKLSSLQKEIAQLQGSIHSDKELQHLNEKRQMNFPLYEELQQLNVDQSVGEKGSINSKDQKELQAAYQQNQFLNEELARLSYEIAVQSETSEQTELFNFYLREEETIQTLLNRRYEIDKQLSELEWMEQSFAQNQEEMAQLESKWNWSSQTPPQLFFDEQEVKQLREAEVARAVDLQDAEMNLQLLQKDLETREENLSSFEEANKEIFRKDASKKEKKVKIVWCIAAVVLVLIGLFLPKPMNFILYGVSLLPLVIGVLPVIYQPKDNYENEKKQWQEKLSQLDYLNEQLIVVKQQLTKVKVANQLAEEELQQKVQENHLGKLDRVDLWMNHRSDITQYLILINTNKELTNQLKENQKNLEEVKQLTEKFIAWLPISRKPLKERIEQIRHFSDQMEKIKFAQEYQADAYSRQTIRELKTKQHDLVEEIRPLLKKYGIVSIESVPQQLQAYQTQDKRKNRYQEIRAILGDLYEEGTTAEWLVQQKKLLTEKQSQDNVQLQEWQTQEQELLYQQQQMLQDGTLDELYQEQAMLKTEIEELALQWSGFWLAGQLLMDLLTELSEQQLPSLLKKATNYFNILTNDSYQEIQLEEGSLILVDKGQQHFTVQDLSTGTRDQLIMAIRFAFLYLQGKRIFSPVMVDDGWLHYDQQRKRHLAKLFESFGETQQIICFSSDREMVSYYQELNQRVIYLEGA